MKVTKTKPTYKRQRYLLEIIAQFGEPIQTLELQNVVYAASVKADQRNYDFIRFGTEPFSFQLEEDLEILERDHFISLDADHDTVQIASKGEAFSNDKSHAFADRMLTRMEHGLESHAKMRPNVPHLRRVLYTIGYEGKSLEMFINLLLEHDVRLLCDVRRNPISRKFGFSKKRLQLALSQYGIGYTHIPELGISSEKRTELESEEDYQVLFDAYRVTLPDHGEAIEEVIDLLEVNNRIALMCYEQNAEMCHRHVLRDQICQVHPVDSWDL